MKHATLRDMRVRPSSRLARFAGVALAASLLSCAGTRDDEDEDDLASSALEEASDGTTCRPKGVEATLKVMTINLRHDANDWTKRFPLIADEIVRLAPDVIGLQEVEIGKNQLERLNDLVAARSPNGRSPFPHRYQKRKSGLVAYFSGEGIGVMSRFPFSEKRSNDLGQRRVATFTRLKLPSGAEVDFYNTHLHHEGGDDGNAWRVKQAREVVSWVKQLDDCHPSIVVGDMNAHEGSEPIRAFTDGAFVDSYRFVHPDRAAMPGFTSPIKLEGDVQNQNPKRRIDWIFAKRPNGLRATPIASEVCFENHDANHLYPSDHLGVLTTYRLSL